MTPHTPRRAATCTAIAFSLVAALTACDPRPPAPKAAPGDTTTSPSPMPPASAASQ
ncbi:MAG TPA: hypothetical protein VFL64_00130 [Rhizobacter sp.]|nr:hypothetical protein [Rhizobacter sp.]